MKTFVMRCPNIGACPQAAAQGVRLEAATFQHANYKAPDCRTCEVKLRVAVEVDDPDLLAPVRRAG